MNRAFILSSLHEADGARQVALARAAEEASELTKEAMKALRFGLENRYPETGPTNAQKIAAEFYDLLEALNDAGLLPQLVFRGTVDARKKAAEAGGFFWLPCDICGEEFSGAEWSPSSTAIQKTETSGTLVCPKPQCSEAAKKSNELNGFARRE